MSYSRWGSGSAWYTYWSYSPESDAKYKWPTEKLRNAQLFEICDMVICQISYGEIKKRGMDILKDVRAFYKKEHMTSNGSIKLQEPTPAEMTELYGYMQLFMQDVDDHFDLHNFFYWEWIVPAKRSIKHLFKNLFKKKN